MHICLQDGSQMIKSDAVASVKSVFNQNDQNAGLCTADGIPHQPLLSITLGFFAAASVSPCAMYDMIVYGRFQKLLQKHSPTDLPPSAARTKKCIKMYVQ